MPHCGHDLSQKKQIKFLNEVVHVIFTDLSKIVGSPRATKVTSVSTPVRDVPESAISLAQLLREIPPVFRGASALIALTEDLAHQ